MNKYTNAYIRSIRKERRFLGRTESLLTAEQNVVLSAVLIYLLFTSFCCGSQVNYLVINTSLSMTNHN